MRDTFFIRHAEPTVLYERAAIRIRNAFITNVQFVCLPCAGFLPWLHDHPDVWSNCRVETMLLNGFFCARDHQRTIPDDLLPTVVDDLAVSKLRLGVTRPEHLVRVHQLMHRPLIHLKSLTLELSQEVGLNFHKRVTKLLHCSLAEKSAFTRWQKYSRLRTASGGHHGTARKQMPCHAVMVVTVRWHDSHQGGGLPPHGPRHWGRGPQAVVLRIGSRIVPYPVRY